MKLIKVPTLLSTFLRFDDVFIRLDERCNHLCNSKSAIRLVTLLMLKSAMTWVTYSTLKQKTSRNEHKSCITQRSRAFVLASRFFKSRNFAPIEKVSSLGSPLACAL